MHIVKIPKGGNKFRTIYVPNAEEKQASKSWMPIILHELKKCEHLDVLHGFMKDRSPVTNAMAHFGWEYSLSFDLQDFFDSVTMNHMPVQLRLNPGTEKYCFYDGAARQGIPSSPLLANLAIMPIAKEIMRLRQHGRFGWTFVFTAYADDLSFSFDRFSTSLWLKRVIPEIVERYGFKINSAKTCLQCSKAGRRMITGVAVDDTLHVPRFIKRKMRAAAHQMQRSLRAKDQHRGLLEWSKLKLPAGYVQPSDKFTIATAIKSIPLAAHDFANTFGSWVRKIL